MLMLSNNIKIVLWIECKNLREVIVEKREHHERIKKRNGCLISFSAHGNQRERKRETEEESDKREEERS